MPPQVQDDGFHEIQLNGKQLVFLFMAATVVSVVIFLCGVLVGRDVRLARSATEVASANPVADVPAPPPSAQAPVPPPSGSDPTAAAPPPPAADDLTYFDRLEKPKPPAEQLRPASADRSGKNDKGDKADRKGPQTDRATPVTASGSNAGAPPKAPAAAAASAPAAHTAEPAGQGYAVQIAALNVRTDAEAIARRLTSKGYAAYVLAPPNGAPAVYRVRVGKFPTRREAESIATRLKREEQFNPWITR